MKYNKTELLLEYYNLDMSDYSDFSLKHGGFPEIHIDVKYPMLSHGMMTNLLCLSSPPRISHHWSLPLEGEIRSGLWRIQSG